MARKKPTTAFGPFLFHVDLLRERIPSFEEYPFNLPAVRHLNRLELHPKVTFFVGENGSGKSTLMEALAVAIGLNAEGGSRNFRFSTRASHSALNRCLRISHRGLPLDSYFLRAESFFNVATEIERLDEEPGGGNRIIDGGNRIIDAYGGKSLHEQSHGESFLAVFLNRFRGNGLYLLDEPESALSPQRQLTFLARLHELCQAGSQLLIATHSPIIMAYPEAWIYVLTPDGLERTPYTDTEHYQVTRAFLTRTEKMLATLMADEEPTDEPPG